MHRRKAFQLMIAGGLAASVPTNLRAFSKNKSFKVEQLTQGDDQHWFGYYDKLQIDVTGRYALGMKAPNNLFRSPVPDDVLEIGVIDLNQGNKWTSIGKSIAWGWQQGCMLQWIPNSSEEVIWNSRLEEGFVTILYNIRNGQGRVLPKPIYTLSPDGSFGLGIDFARLQVYRPGYGYAIKEPQQVQKAPSDSGIYKIDLKTGDSALILSYSDVAKLSRSLGSVMDNYHWINHLLINPSGTRFIFLNRSRPYLTWEEWERSIGKKLVGDDKYITRAVTANIDGSNLYAINDSGSFSHFIWDGDDAICAWAKPEDKDKAAFYLFQDKTKKYEEVGKGTMTVNGHNTYVPNTDNEWILNDTYPNKDREQELYLYHVPTNKKVVLGKFFEPKKFRGEWRCDLHPRCNQQGTKVYFDSTHKGNGRQIYSVDISKIVK